MLEDSWYQELRQRWKPDKIRLLLIGESPPDDGGDITNRRFFYTEHLSERDLLFRGVADALCDSSKLNKGDLKTPWHQRLRDEGLYLIDLASIPVNLMDGSTRRRVLRESVDECVQRVTDLAPDGIAICHTPTFRLLSRPLQAASLPLLHNAPIPFPMGNKRAEFVEKLRAAVAELR